MRINQLTTSTIILQCTITSYNQLKQNTSIFISKTEPEIHHQISSLESHNEKVDRLTSGADLEK